MKAINRAIDRFCYKHPRFGIPGLMKYIVGATIAVFVVGLMDSTGTFYSLLTFRPDAIARGEVWRIVSWIVCPFDSSILTVALSLYFYYFVGTTLEREWGTAKFTIYYATGVLLNMIYMLIVWFGFRSFVVITPMYLNLSMFFAFAVLFPEQVILLFFILPIKIKWLALVDAGLFAIMIVRYLTAGRVFFALMPVVALLGFFVICGSDLLSLLRPLRARGSKQTIDFKKAARQVKREQEQAPYRHKCAVCGKTDVSNPGLEFRYCSRCQGYHCFCIDHINNHVHFN